MSSDSTANAERPEDADVEFDSANIGQVAGFMARHFGSIVWWNPSVEDAAAAADVVLDDHWFVPPVLCVGCV